MNWAKSQNIYSNDAEREEKQEQIREKIETSIREIGDNIIEQNCGESLSPFIDDNCSQRLGSLSEAGQSNSLHNMSIQPSIHEDIMSFNGENASNHSFINGSNSLSDEVFEPHSSKSISNINEQHSKLESLINATSRLKEQIRNEDSMMFERVHQYRMMSNQVASLRGEMGTSVTSSDSDPLNVKQMNSDIKEL
jgi:hypothetical protein